MKAAQGVWWNMARNTVEKSRSRVKVQIINFEVEGDEQSVREGLKSVAAAFGRTSVVATQTRLLQAEARTANGPAAGPIEDAALEEAPLGGVAADQGSEEDAAPSRDKPKRVPTKAKTPDALPVELNADVSLDDFRAGYNANTNPERILVLAMWFRDCRSMPEFKVGHVYTCFRAIDGWSQPKGYDQTLIDMVRKRQTLEKTDAGYKLTHIGEIQLSKMKAK